MSRERHRTVDRITSILEFIAFQPDGATLTECITELDAPKSSIHSLIWGLVDAGWLHEEERRFYLGALAYGLTVGPGGIRPDPVVMAQCQTIVERTGLAMNISMRLGTSLVYVAILHPPEGNSASRYWQIRPAMRRKLLATAPGRALVAAEPPEIRDEVLTLLHREDPRAVPGFVADLPSIERDGYAWFAHNDHQIAALGVAMMNPRTRSLMGISTIGSIDEIEDQREELIEVMHKMRSNLTKDTDS